MSSYFFDSSALLKRYYQEQGTRWVRAEVDPNAGHTILIAQITSVEVVSALSRLQREGVLTAQDAQLAEGLLDQHSQIEYEIIPMTDLLLRQAKSLLRRHPLRAYDAVQLAAALVGNADLLTAGLLPLSLFRQTSACY